MRPSQGIINLPLLASSDYRVSLVSDPATEEISTVAQSLEKLKCVFKEPGSLHVQMQKTVETTAAAQGKHVDYVIFPPADYWKLSLPTFP